MVPVDVSRRLAEYSATLSEKTEVMKALGALEASITIFGIAQDAQIDTPNADLFACDPELAKAAIAAKRFADAVTAYLFARTVNDVR